jgi:hypothetical protein
MDIDFSERLSNIMTLQNLLGGHGLNAHVEAKKLEESAHQKAKSKVDYHSSHLWWKNI